MRLKSQIWLSMALLFLYSCQKKDAPINNTYHSHGGCSNATYYIDPELTSFKFKKNSYWVYIDSVSLAIDSNYVDSILHTDFVRSPNPYCVEMVERYQYRVRKSSVPYYDSVLVAAGYYDVRRNCYIFQDTGQVSEIYYEYNRISSPYTYQGDTILKRDSMFIYDRYYRHVMSVSYKADKNEGGMKTTYYTNTDYGLLRKDVFNTNGSLKNKFLLRSKGVIR